VTGRRPEDVETVPLQISLWYFRGKTRIIEPS